LILEALMNEPSHGYRIAQQIKERSQGVLDFKEGTLYPALHKLENEGLVESYEGVEKGRPRRYYRLTPAGRKMLAEQRLDWAVWVKNSRSNWRSTMSVRSAAACRHASCQPIRWEDLGGDLRSLFGEDAAGLPDDDNASAIEPEVELVDMKSGDLERTVGVNQKTGKIDWSQG
jgi:DNA-binding PadR family transcriptional regulator